MPRIAIILFSGSSLLTQCQPYLFIFEITAQDNYITLKCEVIQLTSPKVSNKPYSNTLIKH